MPHQAVYLVIYISQYLTYTYGTKSLHGIYPHKKNLCKLWWTNRHCKMKQIQYAYSSDWRLTGDIEMVLWYSINNYVTWYSLGDFVSLTHMYLVSSAFVQFPQNTMSPDGYFEHRFHLHTNSSSTYFQLSVVHRYIPFFSRKLLNQTATPHILYYLSCILCQCCLLVYRTRTETSCI